MPLLIYYGAGIVGIAGSSIPSVGIGGRVGRSIIGDRVGKRVGSSIGGVIEGGTTAVAVRTISGGVGSSVATGSGVSLPVIGKGVSALTGGDAPGVGLMSEASGEGEVSGKGEAVAGVVVVGNGSAPSKVAVGMTSSSLLMGVPSSLLTTVAVALSSPFSSLSPSR